MLWRHGAPSCTRYLRTRTEKRSVSRPGARPRSNRTCSDSRASPSKACSFNSRMARCAISSSVWTRPSSPVTFLIFKIVTIGPPRPRWLVQSIRERRKSECAEGLPRSKSRAAGAIGRGEGATAGIVPVMALRDIVIRGRRASGDPGIHRAPASSSRPSLSRNSSTPASRSPTRSPNGAPSPSPRSSS